MSAEAEAVGHHGVDASFSGHVRDVVEVAPFAWVVKIDRGRKHAFVNGQGRDDELDAARGTQCMAELALGARDLELAGVAAEDLLHGSGLGQVAQWGAGAVGVDVVHGLGREPGVFEARVHRADGPAPFFVGRGDMPAVGRHAVAYELGVDLGAAAAGELFGLKDQDARAFGQDEPVAVTIEWPAGARGDRRCGLKVPASRQNRPVPCG